MKKEHPASVKPNGVQYSYLGKWSMAHSSPGFKQEIQEAKKKLPLPKLCERLGITLNQNKGKVPWREDKNPSFSIFRFRSSLGEMWKWKDWGRDEGGDEIDFLAKFQGLSNAEAIRQFKAMAFSGKGGF